MKVTQRATGIEVADEFRGFCEVKSMPCKFKDILWVCGLKAKYWLTTCFEYNESLRPRGDLMIWVSDDATRT